MTEEKNKKDDLNKVNVKEMVERIKKLEDEVCQLTKEKELVSEQNKRLVADCQNFERRFNKDKEQFIKLANLGFVESILDDLDHLKLAGLNLKNEGLNLVLNHLDQNLKKLGLVEIECLGKKFDASLMEVVSQDGKDDLVKKIVRRGYKLNGQVIRFVQVIVG